MKRIFLIFLLFCFSIPSSVVWAQQSDSQLAFKYYQNKEYEKASALFIQLYERTRSKSYFNYYIYSLTNLEKFSDAEKTIKKEIRKNPEDKSFLVELGYLYKLTNKTDLMVKQYEQALKKLIPVDRDIKDLANAFIGKREYEYALLTYQKGRQLRNQPHLYHLEIANIFLYQRNFENMIEEYFDALAVDPTLLNQVQNRLQSALFQDINSSLDPLLKNSLLKRIQQKDESPVFIELLLWYFIQKKSFSPALRQARALDLRLNENGHRMMNLAQLASSNGDYSVALEAYQYILEKGKTSPNYLPARLGILEIRLKTLENKYPCPENELSALENDYHKLLEETEYSARTLPAIIGLAHLQATYLNRTAEATDLLQRAQSLNGLNFESRNQIKMELSDIYLFAGEPWEAILLYAQIEKANKNNPIGYEAKLKKAKIAYYMGDLNWAKAQLDVLKGSTSKLIANDALALSQLIENNTSLDSTELAMQIYARADYLHFQHKDSLALLTLDSILQKYPAHSLTDEVYLKKFQIFKAKSDYDNALKALDQIITDYPHEMLADRALFERGKLYEDLGQQKKAMDSYQQIFSNYPESIFVIESRTRFRQLRGN